MLIYLSFEVFYGIVCVHIDRGSYDNDGGEHGLVIADAGEQRREWG